MIGSFLTRGLVLIFGYAYPAYECYKTVEKNKPEIEQLRFWCQYWILVAVLTVCERFGDAFISWVPMYSEAKLAFFVYLWYPKTKGTTYVYDSFFRPYLAKHETEIDQNLLELRTRAGDIAVLYWQRAASYGQTRIYDILHYVAAQSTPQPRPSQPQQPSVRVGKTPATSNRQAASPVEPQTEEPPSPTSSTSSSQHQKEVAEEVGRTFFNQRPAAVQQPSVRVGKTPVTPNRQAASPVEPQTEEPPSPSSSTSSSHHQKEVAEEVGRTFFKRPPAAVGVNTQKATAAPKPTSEATPTEAEPIQIEVAPSSNDESTNPAPKETLIEEAIRVTRGRLRKARSAGKSAKNES